MNKTIFAIYLACITYGCNGQTTDSIFLKSSGSILDSNGVCKQCTDLVWHGNVVETPFKQVIVEDFDSLTYYRKRCDTLYGKLWEQNIRLNRIKHYWALYRKTPKYLNFLNSWINRAEN